MNKVAFLEGYMGKSAAKANPKTWSKLFGQAGKAVKDLGGKAVEVVKKEAPKVWKSTKDATVKGYNNTVDFLKDLMKKKKINKKFIDQAVTDSEKAIRERLGRAKKGEQTIADLLFGTKLRTGATMTGATALAGMPIAYGVGKSKGRKKTRQEMMG